MIICIELTLFLLLTDPTLNRPRYISYMKETFKARILDYYEKRRTINIKYKIIFK